MLALISECDWKILNMWLLNQFAFSLSVMAKRMLGFIKKETMSFSLVLFFIVFHKEPSTGVSDECN
jgi:hypothetical protein